MCGTIPLVLNIDYEYIKVPITWAGIGRELQDGRFVWACGGCLDPDSCAADGCCQRATDEDFARGLFGGTDH